MNVRAIAIVLTLVPAAVAASAQTAPTLDELGNLTYVGVLAEPVTLRNGEYLGAPFIPGGSSRPRIRLAPLVHAAGDLDGDGIVEAAVVLAHDSGGSGTDLFVAVVARHDGELRNITTAGLGDRLQVRAIAVAERILTLDVVTQGPTDPMCCPTAKQRWHLALDRDGIAIAAVEAQGQLSLTDLEGVTWRLMAIGVKKPVPSGLLVTAVFAKGQVGGAGGCNRYTGLVTLSGSQPQFGPLAATRMSCDPQANQIESAYFSALGEAESFGFSLGRLAIAYTGPDGPDVLLFESQNAAR